MKNGIRNIVETCLFLIAVEMNCLPFYLGIPPSLNGSKPEYKENVPSGKGGNDVRVAESGNIGGHSLVVLFPRDLY